MKLALYCLAAATVFAADIPAGSHLLLRMQNSINSRTARPGDFVYLQTATPVAVDGNVVVPVGSYVRGVVAEVNRAGKVKGRAQLAIALESLTLASGKEFKFGARVASIEGDAGGQRVVDRESTIQQGSSVGRDVGQVAIFTGNGTWIGALGSRWSSGGSVAKGIGIGAGAGAAVGLATTLLTRGRDVDLRQGSSLDIVFDKAVPLQ
jgi:type IV secretion system protein VirB10